MGSSFFILLPTSLTKFPSRLLSQQHTTTIAFVHPNPFLLVGRRLWCLWFLLFGSLSSITALPPIWWPPLPLRRALSVDCVYESSAPSVLRGTIASLRKTILSLRAPIIFLRGLFAIHSLRHVHLESSRRHGSPRGAGPSRCPCGAIPRARHTFGLLHPPRQCNCSVLYKERIPTKARASHSATASCHSI